MQSQEKLLLMGPSGGGKTCMRSVIFENYLPRDALRLLLSVGIDSAKIRILNNLHLNLWDCGGQKEYVTNYLTKQKEYIFRNVCVMLFVFDILHLTVEDSQNGAPVGGADLAAMISDAGALLAQPQQKKSTWKKDEMLHYFVTAVSFLREHSPNAKIFVLLHKVDTISPDYRAMIVEQRRKEIISRLVTDGGISEAAASQITFFSTSLWSNSLYFAYSNVVRSLVPHRGILINELKKLHKACDASEVALYEKHTLLTICHVNEQGEVDAADSEERTAKLAEIVKGFKLSCLQSGTSFQDLQLRLGGGRGTALLSRYTECTLVLVVCKDPKVRVELQQLQVEAQCKSFGAYLASKDPVAAAMREVL